MIKRSVQVRGVLVVTDPCIKDKIPERVCSLYGVHLSRRLNLMRSSALCAGMTESETEELVGLGRSKCFDRRASLFEQGQPVRQILFIESGSVKLTQLSHGGSEVILWLHGAGDAVGLTGSVASSLHTCSARAVLATRVMIWDWSTLERGFPAAIKIKRNLGRILSERLGELEERFREVATERVSRRVALALLRIGKRVGQAGSNGIEVFLSREELAQLTGTTLFTISRLMSKWGEMEIVAPRREAVLILDVDLLTKISELCD
jgi:CRP/FNR family transcriptional regulator, nitrogen oxide reductase regulator